MSDDNRELQENAFARLAGAMVTGAGISKLMESLKDKKKAKDAMQKFQDTLDKAEKEAKERLKKLPKDEQDYILKMIGELPRK